jgi:hypothetical protein
LCDAPSDSQDGVAPREPRIDDGIRHFPHRAQFFGILSCINEHRGVVAQKRRKVIMKLGNFSIGENNDVVKLEGRCNVLN